MEKLEVLFKNFKRNKPYQEEKGKSALLTNEIRSNSYTISNKRINLNINKNENAELKQNKEGKENDYKTGIKNDDFYNNISNKHNNSFAIEKNLENSFEYYNPKNNYNTNANIFDNNHTNNHLNTNTNSILKKPKNDLLSSINLNSGEKLKEKVHEANLNSFNNFNNLNDVVIEKAFTINNETWILVSGQVEAQNLPVYHWLNLNLFDLTKEQLKVFNKEYLII